MSDNILTFQSLYKSITALTVPGLPKLVVLTGANGSGKSHILEAIRDGHVTSSIAPNRQTDIAHFDWNTILPNDTAAHNPAQSKLQQNAFYTQLKIHRDRHLPQLATYANQIGLPLKNFASFKKIRRLTDKATFTQMLPDPEQADALHLQFIQQLTNIANGVKSQTANNQNDELHKAALAVYLEDPTAFVFDDEASFFDHSAFLWGDVDPFRQAFAKLFSTYREVYRANLTRIGAEKMEVPTEPALSEDEFHDRYGRPPWEFVNGILELNRFDFRIDHPDLTNDSAYEPRLRKISKDIDMRFGDLSSGEKVLMSFALCLYNSLEKRQGKHFPKLLLLDEVDAPLHPSMVRFLLDTIQTTLVGEHNVSVILATHKPSTVGLAPEEAIYLMNPDGPAIEKTTQAKALAVLTEGVPTMSISFDGRRQVFVESPRDAKILDTIFQRHKVRLASERSLNFISAGTTKSDGQDEGTGCARVKDIVKQLTNAGNQSVLGLIDWDGKNNPGKRIHILCHKLRDGLENLLLDPVLVIAALAHHKPQYARTLGLLEEDETFRKLECRTTQHWQDSVDNLVLRVCELSNNSGEQHQVTYLNGMTLTVSGHYLAMDDHQLAKRVEDVFGALAGQIKEHRSLNAYICNAILAEYPNLLPQDILDTFKALLGDEL